MLDLTNVKSQKPQTTIPDGKYICNCTKAEMRDTKSGGMMIAVELTVRSGDHEGRKIFHNFNVQNSNQKAVEIGLAQLKSFLETSGHKDPNKLGGTEELEGLTVGVKTKTRKDEDYGDRSEVSYFFKPDTGDAKPMDNIGF